MYFFRIEVAADVPSTIKVTNKKSRNVKQMFDQAVMFDSSSGSGIMVFGSGVSTKNKVIGIKMHKLPIK